MEEIWRDIEGYEGLYQISSLGRVKSLERIVIAGGVVGVRKRNEKLLKQHIVSNGYIKANLWKNGKIKNHLVHRLVAQAFIPNPENLPQVNHKDEDKTNNMVWVNEDGSIDYVKSNLEWCDREYNCNYGTRIERIIKPQCKPVIALKDDKICLYFNSLADAGRFGYNFRNISECCLGNRKTHKGYRWMFLEDYLADWWDMEMEKAA